MNSMHEIIITVSLNGKEVWRKYTHDPRTEYDREAFGDAVIDMLDTLEGLSNNPL